MRSREAVELCERLIGLCDVVVENFRPGVLDGWGIGYERQRELNPDIIYISMPGMGIGRARGASELAFGQSLLAYTGRDGHLGAAGVSGHHAAQGAAAGLLRRGDGRVRGAGGAGAARPHRGAAR